MRDLGKYFKARIVYSKTLKTWVIVTIRPSFCLPERSVFELPIFLFYFFASLFSVGTESLSRMFY